MTFRIDEMELGSSGWRVQIKGMEGKGIYGRLTTAPDGRGLFVVDDQDISMRKPGRRLLAEPEFCVPPDTKPEDAMRRVADALERLGWGPEVNQAGKVVCRVGAWKP